MKNRTRKGTRIPNTKQIQETRLLYTNKLDPEGTIPNTKENLNPKGTRILNTKEN